MKSAAHPTTHTRATETNPRIARLRKRYQTGDATISVERARYYTESWKQTADSGLSRQVRVAMAMQRVYERMTHRVDADDRIAGHWTEHFLGVPIDIERGVFNEVVGAELSKWTMVGQRTQALAKTARYIIRRRAVTEFVRNQKIARRCGGAPLNLELKTMQERDVNPFQIGEPERHELVRELLPAWRGETLVDALESELAGAGLHSDDMRELAMSLPGNTSRQVMMLSSAATIATIQGHLILNYDKVLNVGLSGMLAEVRERMRAPDLSAEQTDALRSMEISLEGVNTFAERLCDEIVRKLETVRNDGARGVLRRMLETCRAVPQRPAKTFREAVQALWTVKTAVELAHPVNLHCFGRLDQILEPYYQADLVTGEITEDDAVELLEELLLKMMSQNLRPESNVLSNFYHRFFGSTPVTLAGTGPNGEEASNELTYLFLRAAHRCKAVTNVSIRISPDTPDRLLETVAKYLADGTSSFSLFNDTVNVEAMERRGFSQEDARDYAVMGCVETTSPGRTGCMSANALLLSRVLDITLRNGDSRTLAGTLRADGLRTGVPDEFADFDSFVEAFLKQGAYFIEKIVKGSNLRDRVYAETLPAPTISAFTDGCLQKARDVTKGGGKYDLSGISMINSIANVTDSLYTIKKLVFEDKKFDFRTMLAAIDANFVGYENVERAIHAVRGKWGNGNPETDQLAHRVMRALCDETYKYRTYLDGPFVVFAISMTTHTIDGRLSIATPDGRKAATPYAASGNPYNVERAGVTGVLRSVAALPGDDLMGCAVNVRFHPSGIGQNDAARAKWVSLVRTYFELGGSQMQPTVASVETLRKAQKEPDQYRDLIIKVGGYSTYFVDLGSEIQEEIIARTEHA